MWKWLKKIFSGTGPSVVSQPAPVQVPQPVVTEPYKPEVKPDPYAPLPENETPWKQVALKEEGVAEIPGEKENPRILEYHAATKLKAASELTSWCSAFISWVMKEAGYKTMATAWARDWLSYGKKLSVPVPWCIVVLERNAPGGDSHVTFWTGKRKDGKIEVFGGNQGNKVCFAWYAEKDILGYRWPVKN
jgi:uncharacterized protein (TIGR02594 family)